MVRTVARAELSVDVAALFSFDVFLKRIQFSADATVRRPKGFDWFTRKGSDGETLSKADFPFEAILRFRCC